MCVLRVCELNCVSTYLHSLSGQATRIGGAFVHAGEIESLAHILLMPDLMQLLIGMSMSCMLEPAEQDLWSVSSRFCNVSI